MHILSAPFLPKCSSYSSGCVSFSRRSAGFQTALSSSSLSGGVNGCHALPSYPIKQEGYKLGSALSDFSGGMGAGRRELDRQNSGGGGGEGNLATVLSLSAMAGDCVSI